MKQLNNQLQLTDYVQFIGWVAPEKVKHYIAAADICVAPEPSNPYNDRCTVIKIAEYMALSKPVVAFDLPEHRVTAHNAAVYARPNSELDFAQKICCLMDDPERRTEMGRIGRKRVATVLAWPHQLKHLLAAYESAGLTAAA
jgi:glycosyltransferase involved in cell wall biosynthesis